ncbi:hypothetical protein EXIGLDRAFT_762273 [Exidia glandulosa HHB12029]|uniref:Uncharacterized protein n=1 Tax=Exidia glandulosa HHB12029 TaxID=1314781 RepID=A0A165MV73_EXIGL|nr:hypothetical protein EXIGLDRAFT_762273 [Exidia glandulosa HHB12029]
MANEGWPLLMDLAQLAVNTCRASRRPKNKHRIQVGQGIEPTDGLGAWARIHNLVACHQISLLPSHHEPPTVAVPPLQTPWPDNLPRDNSHCLLTSSAPDEPQVLPRPCNDHQREPVPFRPDPMCRPIYEHVARRTRFYIPLVGGVALTFLTVQLWTLWRVVMLHVAPS